MRNPIFSMSHWCSLLIVLFLVSLPNSVNAQNNQSVTWPITSQGQTPLRYMHAAWEMTETVAPRPISNADLAVLLRRQIDMHKHLSQKQIDQDVSMVKQGASMAAAGWTTRHALLFEVDDDKLFLDDVATTDLIGGKRPKNDIPPLHTTVYFDGRHWIGVEYEGSVDNPQDTHPFGAVSRNISDINTSTLSVLPGGVNPGATLFLQRSIISNFSAKDASNPNGNSYVLRKEVLEQRKPYSLLVLVDKSNGYVTYISLCDKVTGKAVYTYQASEFHEVHKGTWYPSKVVFNADNLVRIFKLKQLALGDDCDLTDLKRGVPNGTVVHDMRFGTGSVVSYRIGTHGLPDDTWVRNLRDGITKSNAALAAQQARLVRKRQYAVIWMMLVVVAGTVMYILRRQRSASNHDS